jgi:LysR family transcriptional regulator, hydrogen peroxide-inducible genes activator
MPSLRQLEYLVAIADLRNFRRAAQACNVSQPTLSQQLRALEDRLGVDLVERRLAGAELTPVGRDVAERARHVLIEVKDIRDLARRAAAGAAGIIHFGVTPTLGPYLMPGIVAAIHREQAHLKLYIREGIPDDLALDLARGQLDMLLGPLPIDGEGLHVEPLFREPLHLVGPAGDPLGERPLRAEELRDLPVLTLDNRHHFHRQAAALCADWGMRLVRDYEGTSLDALQQMVSSGLGFAILPQCYLRSAGGGTGGLSLLRVEGWRATRSIAAAWRSGAAFAETYAMIARRVQDEGGRIDRLAPGPGI